MVIYMWLYFINNRKLPSKWITNNISTNNCLWYYRQACNKYVLPYRISGCHDKKVRVFCRESLQLLHTIKDHKSGVTCLASDMNIIVSGAMDWFVLYNNFQWKYSLLMYILRACMLIYIVDIRLLRYNSNIWEYI